MDIAEEAQQAILPRGAAAAAPRPRKSAAGAPQRRICARVAASAGK